MSEQGNLGRGSAHWPIVPPQQDGTAADTDRREVEYAEPGRGWRIAALVFCIALVFAGMLGAVLMFSGSGR